MLTKSEILKEVSIIGGGIGGIATSIRLASAGFNVRLFEAGEKLGGKLNELKIDGFRFDTGPSLFTLPSLVEELYELAGIRNENFFQYKKLDIICKYFFEHGTVINAWQDPIRFASEIESFTSDSSQSVLEFLTRSRMLYDLTANVFIHKSFHDISTFFTRDFARAATNFYKLGAFSTMHELISKNFIDRGTIQLFDRYATYNGSNPYKAPGTLNVIPHLEHNIGAFFPENGMYSIIKSLLDLALKKGVEIHLNSKVVKILTERGRVKEIKLGNGQRIESEIIVSDIDIVYLYQLLDNYNIARRFLQQERSTSALIFYWPVNKSFPELELHNILFSNNYQEEFNYLFNKKEVFVDPTVYIFISSKKVKEDAPEGCENWFVMINVPENIGQDWGKMRSEVRKRIQEKINRALGIRIQEYISGEYCWDPPGIEEKTSSFHGSLYGTSSNSVFSAFRRHSNFSNRVKGLYFSGGSVHPGGGIPLCLSSAKIVAERIVRKYS